METLENPNIIIGIVSALVVAIGTLASAIKTFSGSKVDTMQALRNMLDTTIQQEKKEREERRKLSARVDVLDNILRDVIEGAWTLYRQLTDEKITPTYTPPMRDDGESNPVAKKNEWWK